MDPLNEVHVSEPGLVVADVEAADDGTARAFQQLLAERWATATAPAHDPRSGRARRTVAPLAGSASAHRLAAKWRAWTPRSWSIVPRC
ncbi:DUF6207 family protein [Streptomyces puniciscabiei]|uniref:DUF6207 family protein n=1 Tax=Streptomyces puniciscabiei TaxID=164348 RepID=UPI0033176D74